MHLVQSSKTELTLAGGWCTKKMLGRGVQCIVNAECIQWCRPTGAWRIVYTVILTLKVLMQHCIFTSKCSTDNIFQMPLSELFRTSSLNLSWIPDADADTHESPHCWCAQETEEPLSQQRSTGDKKPLQNNEMHTYLNAKLNTGNNYRQQVHAKNSNPNINVSS